MQNTRKIMIAFLLFFLFSSVFPAFSQTAQASEIEVIEAETTLTVKNTLPDHLDLFDGYLTQLFYPQTSVSFFGETAREQLSPLGKHLYDFLKAHLLDVSSGKTASTLFSLSGERLAAWGGTQNYDCGNAQNSQIAASQTFSAFKEEFDVDMVLSALLHDCPYDLYWYDKVSGVTEIGSFSLNNGICSIQSIDFRFSIVADMQADTHSTEAPVFDTTQVTAAATAANNAKNIVQKYAAATDVERLLAYKKEICAFVEYDSNAAVSGNFSEDADPWHLIHVFDGDSSTNVVCEGYTKAFQYLYDLSSFTNHIDCITVYGTLSGTGHMWNIISINDTHYLADITNSDSATAGADGSLFLAGASRFSADSYSTNGLAYTYHPDMFSLWGGGDNSPLFLTGQDFDINSNIHSERRQEESAPTCNQPGLSGGLLCSICGLILREQTEIPATGHSYQTIITEPACTQAGYTRHLCQFCGDYFDENFIVAKGHVYLDAWDTVCNICGFERELTVSTTPMHRLYNPYTQEHLLTSSNEEKKQLTNAGWHYDGVAWQTPLTGDPVYRLYNPYDDWHTYTMSQEEIDLLLPLGWKVDGVVCYSAIRNVETPIYRLFNPHASINYHLLTASKDESSWLIGLGWILEGIGWYGIR